MPIKTKVSSFESLIDDMLKTGTSIEDIADLFADALNAQTEKARKAEKEKAKMKDATQLMVMVSAFFQTHYGEDAWDQETIETAAKDFIKSLDAAHEMLGKITALTSDIKPAGKRMNVKVVDDYAKAEKFFNELIASLK